MTTIAARRTIGQTFAELKQRHAVALVPFVPAGYPDLATTSATLLALDSAGASVIEVGFPFSDPVADGPTIQEAFTAALAKKLKVSEIFATVKATRSRVATPLVAMVSYSIVFRYGRGKFFADAQAAGFDGIIVPDLPPPEAQVVCDEIRAAGLDTILLIAPTTAPERRGEIARLCTGFVYYLSVSGITGERDKLPANLAENIAQIRAVTDKPICVGFGIHRPEQVVELGKIAQGAIVGSAIVKRMKDHATEGAEAIAGVVKDYVAQLVQDSVVK